MKRINYFYMSTLKGSISHNPLKRNGTLPFKFDPYFRAILKRRGSGESTKDKEDTVSHKQARRRGHEEKQRDQKTESVRERWKWGDWRGTK